MVATTLYTGDTHFHLPPTLRSLPPSSPCYRTRTRTSLPSPLLLRSSSLCWRRYEVEAKPMLQSTMSSTMTGGVQLTPHRQSYGATSLLRPFLHRRATPELALQKGDILSIATLVISTIWDAVGRCVQGTHDSGESRRTLYRSQRHGPGPTWGMQLTSYATGYIHLRPPTLRSLPPSQCRVYSCCCRARHPRPQVTVSQRGLRVVYWTRFAACQFGLSQLLHHCGRLRHLGRRLPCCRCASDSTRPRRTLYHGQRRVQHWHEECTHLRLPPMLRSLLAIELVVHDADLPTLQFRAIVTKSSARSSSARFGGMRRTCCCDEGWVHGCDLAVSSRLTLMTCG